MLMRWSAFMCPIKRLIAERRANSASRLGLMTFWPEMKIRQGGRVGNPDAGLGIVSFCPLCSLSTWARFGVMAVRAAVCFRAPPACSRQTGYRTKHLSKEYAFHSWHKAICAGDRDFAAKLIRCTPLALSYALQLWCIPRINFWFGVSV